MLSTWKCAYIEFRSTLILFSPGSTWIMLSATPADVVGARFIPVEIGFVWDDKITMPTGFRRVFGPLAYYSHPGAADVFIPYWLLVLISIGLTAVPWIRWSKRFRLHTLLIMMTAISIALAVIVRMSRR